MGAAQSNLSIDGYQIARVIPNSPAHRAGLIPYFDFILNIDNLCMATEDSTFFREYIKKNQGQAVKMNVYNTKIRNVREVSVEPSNNWGGQGLLGCSINWENTERALEYPWRILSVNPGSPAAQCGLGGHKDYIVGMQSSTPEDISITMFHDPTDFQQRLALRREAAKNPMSKFYNNYDVLLLVYDSLDNSIREIMCRLTGGSLGCDIGTGYLHSIPITPGDMRLPWIKQFWTADTPPAAAPSHLPQSTLTQPPPPQPVHQTPELAYAPSLPAQSSPVTSEVAATQVVPTTAFQAPPTPQQQVHSIPAPGGFHGIVPQAALPAAPAAVPPTHAFPAPVPVPMAMPLPGGFPVPQPTGPVPAPASVPMPTGSAFPIPQHVPTTSMQMGGGPFQYPAPAPAHAVAPTHAPHPPSNPSGVVNPFAAINQAQHAQQQPQAIPQYSEQPPQQ